LTPSIFFLSNNAPNSQIAQTASVMLPDLCSTSSRMSAFHRNWSDFSTSRWARTRLFEAQRSEMLDAHSLAAGLARANEAFPRGFTFRISNMSFIIPSFQAACSSTSHRRFDD
jgi:hypothetical protein